MFGFGVGWERWEGLQRLKGNRKELITMELTRWLRMLVAMQVACIEFYDEDTSIRPSPALKAMRKIHTDMGLLIKRMEREER